MSAISKFACHDLKNNGRQKLLFLGETGNGKSALCNALSQPVKKDGGHLCQNFPESSNQRIGNTETILQNVDFLGISGKEISLIDTVGFNSTEMNNTAIAELIVSLKESCDYINLFAIVVASPLKRIEASLDSLRDTIKLFEGMFGEERFWQNTLLIFTNLQQSDDQISRRSRTNSDQQLIRDFNATIRETFNLQIDVPTLIIDAHYDGSKLKERNRFTISAYKLDNMLMESVGTSVDDVKRVVGKYEGLQEEVNRLTRQVENDRIAAEKARQEYADYMKKVAVGVGLGVGGVALAGAGLAAGLIAGRPAIDAAVAVCKSAVATAATEAAPASRGLLAPVGMPLLMGFTSKGLAVVVSERVATASPCSWLAASLATTAVQVIRNAVRL